MAKKVYILYEGDQWISHESLVPMGVFDSWMLLMTAVTTLLQQQIDNGYHETNGNDEEYLKNALEEVEQYHQFRGHSVSIYIKTVKMNKLEEF